MVTRRSNRVFLGRIFTGIIAKFRGSIHIVCPPMIFVAGLAVGTSAEWLPRFVECLEHEDVRIPVKSSTNPLLIESLCISRASFSGSVIRSTCLRVSDTRGDYMRAPACRWPSSLSVPELNSGSRTCGRLDHAKSLL